MKKVLIAICILLPFSLNAQKVSKHHFEIGTGVAVPGEFLFDNYFEEKSTLDLYGEYRYDLSKMISVGAFYSFVMPHAAELSSKSVIDDAESAGSKTQDYDLRTMQHTLNAFVEFKTEAYGPMRFFAGLGGGVQMRTLNTNRTGYETYNFFSADASLHAGLEFFDHLRITLGHCHDLYYPFTDLSPGAPYYFVNVGWSF